MARDISKVIWILTDKHFEKRDYHRYGIPEIQKQRFLYEVWCTVNWTYVKAKFNVPQNVMEEQWIYMINDKSTFLNKLKKQNMKKTFFIIYPGQLQHGSDVGLYIRQQIFYHGGKYANYYYPEILRNNIEINNNLLGIVKYYVKEILEYNDFEQIKRVFKLITCPCSFNFMQARITADRLNNKFDLLSKKTIVLHTQDYDDYLVNRYKDKLINSRYIVYVDQFYLGHSDFEKMGIKKGKINKDQYFQIYNNFFDAIEKKYNCEVVIALHPKAEYNCNPFDGRKMIRYNTDILIRDALYCIIETSLSINNILLYKKKYWRITSDYRMKINLMRDYYNNWKKFGDRILNISNELTDNLDKSLNDSNDNRYKKYIRDYIKSENSIDKPNIEVMLKYIQM